MAGGRGGLAEARKDTHGTALVVRVHLWAALFDRLGHHYVSPHRRRAGGGGQTDESAPRND